MPRSFAAGLWLVVTVLLTGMVWTATSIVAADVTDRPAPVVAPQDVLSELESGSAAGPAPTTTTPPSPTTTVPARNIPNPAGQSPPATAAPPPPTSQPGVTVAPAPAPAVAPPPPTTTPPTVPPTTQPSPTTGTYSTPGGVVRVACNVYFIDLVSAIPNNGFTVNVLSAGPANVDVHFVGPGQDLSVRAVCFGGPIRY